MKRRLVPFLPVFGVLTVSWLTTGLRAGEAAEKPLSRNFEVEVVRDVPYYEGEGADRVKHKLDLYLPRGKQDFPVLFFVHGGAWSAGDKNSPLGIYRNFGTFWASHGIGTVVTNYRLSPKVVHPAHIQDVARAFAWTYRNIAKYHGRADEIFVCGHSAGGHLVALLATDDTYLKAHGLGLKAIRGAIPMSGVYTLVGQNSLVESVFGTDPKVQQDASPMAHVHEGEPPFLVICADNDFLMCGKGPSERFCKALSDRKCSAKMCEIKGRNHLTLIMKASMEHDPAAELMAEFIAAHTRPKDSQSRRP